MAIPELTEACAVLFRMPALWIPGIAGGLLAALLWLTYIYSGAFFAGRLILVFGLVLLFFITGLYVLIRDGSGDLRAMVGAGKQQYFRVLLPQLVIGFTILLIFILLVLTLTLAGIPPDPGMILFLSFGVMIPGLLLTFFADTAAVFEDRRVFDAIQRSIELVSLHLWRVITFFAVSAVVACSIIFTLMIVWEALLYAKLEPITRYSEEQLRLFTPDQLLALIGTEGIWVTAAILFVAMLVLIPLLASYKACFFRSLGGGSTPIIQQMSGEYDSKGRWYKY